MSIKNSSRKAREKYRKKVVELRVELYPTDADIKARLSERVDAGEGKATYIKRLIREDIKKQPAKLTYESPFIKVLHKYDEE